MCCFELSWVELRWVLIKKNMKLSQPQLLNTTLKQPEVYSPRIFKNFNLTRIQSSCLFVYKSLYTYNIIQAAMIHTDLQLDFDISLLSFLGLKICSCYRLWNIKLGLIICFAQFLASSNLLCPPHTIHLYYVGQWVVNCTH